MLLLWEVIIKSYIIRKPWEKKLYRWELQPYRNAGDSPECWYFNGLANSAGNIIMGQCVEAQGAKE
jgi:hypothetical protein